MSQKWVLDASALLAAIQNEQGSEFVKQNIEHAVISSVNWSEVLQKITANNMNPKPIEAMLMGLGLTIIDFSNEDARLAASLWGKGKNFGLSLADRACLATGIRTQRIVVTADKVWKQLNDEVEVYLIR